MGERYKAVGMAMLGLIGLGLLLLALWFGFRLERVEQAEDQRQAAPVEQAGGQEQPGYKLDNIDQAILDLVTANPSMTDSEVAAKLGLTRQAVNARRRSMEKGGRKVRPDR